MKEQISPFHTELFPLAAFLLDQGLEFIGAVRKRDSRQVYFVFKDTDDREYLEQRFLDWNVKNVNARAFDKATKVIRDAIKEAKVVEDL